MEDKSVWLLLEVVKAMHEAQLAECEGLGTDDGAFLAALERPENHFAYVEPNLFTLVATYPGGIIKNHPFADGNKRTGFLIAFTFLCLLPPLSG